MFGKQHLVSLVLLLLFKASLFSQSTDSLLKTIRVKYQTIKSNLKNYDTVTVDIWEQSTEGGEATGYYKKDKKRELKLIKENLFGETGKVEYEYYFDNSRLIFIFEKRHKYNRPIYWDEKHMKESNDIEIFDPKKTIITEDRYYFYQEKIIRWLNNEKKEVDLLVVTNAKVGEDLVADANRLRDELRKR